MTAYRAFNRMRDDAGPEWVKELTEPYKYFLHATEEVQGGVREAVATPLRYFKEDDADGPCARDQRFTTELVRTAIDEVKPALRRWAKRRSYQFSD